MMGTQTIETVSPRAAASLSPGRRRMKAKKKRAGKVGKLTATELKEVF
jgi:hypothetical protein